MPTYLKGTILSVEALAIVLNHSKARGAAKIVLMGIANHINPDNDGAWPSQAKLAGYANVSDRAVRDAVETLVGLGELRYETAAGLSTSQYKPNRYWLTLSCPAECDGTTNHRIRAEVSDNRVEVSNTQGGSFQHSGWKQASDEPLIEPLKEPNKKSSKINSDFEVSETMREWFKENKFTFDVELATVKFVDYYIGTGKTMKDWNAAWRNWMRNTADYQKPAWERSKDVAAVENQIRREIEVTETRKLFEQSQEAAKRATAAPKCEHGKSIVSCLTCIKSVH